MTMSSDDDDVLMKTNTKKRLIRRDNLQRKKRIINNDDEIDSDFESNSQKLQLPKPLKRTGPSLYISKEHKSDSSFGSLKNNNIFSSNKHNKSGRYGINKYNKNDNNRNDSSKHSSSKHSSNEYNKSDSSHDSCKYKRNDNSSDFSKYKRNSNSYDSSKNRDNSYDSSKYRDYSYDSKKSKTIDSNDSTKHSRSSSSANDSFSEFEQDCGNVDDLFDSFPFNDPSEPVKSAKDTLILPEKRKENNRLHSKKRPDSQSPTKKNDLQSSRSKFNPSSRADDDSKKSSTSKLVIPNRTSHLQKKAIRSVSTSDDDDDSFMSDWPSSRLILPSRKKRDETNDDSSDDCLKLDESERNKIMKKLEKTHLREQKTVFTCPFCLIAFDKTTTKIQQSLDQLEEKEKKYKLKVKEENKHSSFKKPDELIKRPVPTAEKEAFCRLHYCELVIRPEGRKKGYPFDIDFNKLRERIKKMQIELDEVISKKIPSDYRNVVLDAYDSMGANKARTPMMMMTRFELLSPGYYGPRGAAVMLDVLSDLYLKSGRLNKQKTAPQMPMEYLQQVLIPETAYRLIRQDIVRNHQQLNTGKPLANANTKAKEIMLQSCRFGEAMYPLIDDKEEDIIVQTEKKERKNDTVILD